MVSIKLNNASNNKENSKVKFSEIGCNKSANTVMVVTSYTIEIDNNA